MSLTRPDLNSEPVVVFHTDVYSADASVLSGGGNIGLSTDSNLNVGALHAGQSHYAVAGASGLHSGSAAQTSIGSILNVKEAKTFAVSGAGIATSAQNTHQLFGTGTSTEYKSAIGPGGITESGQNNIMCCGQDICNCDWSCQNGCIKCDLDLCGKDCNFDCCSGITSCCSNAFKLVTSCFTCIGDSCKPLLECISSCGECISSCIPNN